mgnify:CR=1 FL=1
MIEKYEEYIPLFKIINLQRLENDGFKKMAKIYNKKSVASMTASAGNANTSYIIYNINSSVF